jgi:hypothetical protein
MIVHVVLYKIKKKHDRKQLKEQWTSIYLRYLSFYIFAV